MTNKEIQKHYTEETMNYLANVFSSITDRNYLSAGSIESIKLKLIFEGCISLEINDKLLKDMAREFLIFYEKDPYDHSSKENFLPKEFFDYKNRF